MVRKRRFKGRSRKISGWQFAAIAIAVAAVFTVAGLVLRSLLMPHAVEPSAKTSPIVPQQPDSPPDPPKSLGLSPLPIPTHQPERENVELAYNIGTPPDLKESEALQVIVNKVVSLAADKNLPTKPLSITLIDVKSKKFAAYQQEKLRYPASVVKMFWMVYLYAQIEKGVWQNKTDWDQYLERMIKKSDNEAASYILDLITGTTSGVQLEGEEYNTWLNKRQQVNRFFQKAGYEDINITQKTFPVPYINLQEPQGRDLQMRGDPKNPIRNKITTQHAARLMYEIANGLAISPSASEQMTQLLARDLNPEVWNNKLQNAEEFNPIRGFLGESLPANVRFLSKAGWTSNSRNEVAFVTTRGGGAVYILAIFADDRAYAQDGKIFPKMSRLVFDRMSSSSSSR